MENHGENFEYFSEPDHISFMPKNERKYKFEVKIKSKIIIIFFISQFDLIMG